MSEVCVELVGKLVEEMLGLSKEELSPGGADSYLDSGLRRQPQPPPAVVYRIVDGPAALPEGL